MENKEIILVTAFFDIGREAYTVYSRTNEEYFDYFDFWACIENRLIVYCEPENEEKIRLIREKYHREGETMVVPIANIKAIEPKIYERMKAVEQNKRFVRFRYYSDALSNKADYNYLMMLKYWFLWDATSRYKDQNAHFVWLDFGYNHGNAYYLDKSDFNFKWTYDFDEKINLFCLSDPDAVSSIDSLQFQNDCIIGHTVVCTREISEKLWGYVKEMIEALLALDCMDDDQQLLLMAYKAHKEEFTIRICDWFHDIELCSDHKFCVVDPPDMRSHKRKYKKKNKEFIAKCKERAEEYYF